METKKMEPWKIPLCALAGTASAPHCYHCFADGRSWAIGRTSRTILELFFGPGTAGWSCARFNGSLDNRCSDGGALVPGKTGKSGATPGWEFANSFDSPFVSFFGGLCAFEFLTSLLFVHPHSQTSPSLNPTWAVFNILAGWWSLGIPLSTTSGILDNHLIL